MDYHPHITSYSGHQVLDESGDAIGTITDVVFEDGSTTTAWFIVDPGWLRSNRFVPADGAHQSPNGDVIVTYNKRWVTTPGRNVTSSDPRASPWTSRANPLSRRTPAAAARASWVPEPSPE